MWKILITTLIINSICRTQANIRPNITKNFIYKTYEYDTRIQVLVNDSTDQIMDFYEKEEGCQGCPTRVHVSTNNSLNVDYPVFITSLQQKAVTSWSLPLVVKTNHWMMVFSEMGRTLCPHDAGPNVTENRPTIQLATTNSRNVTVDIKLRRVNDFYIELDKEVSLNVTPSTPKYYYFSFDQNPWNVTSHVLGDGIRPSFNYTIPKSVILIVESEDEVCATVSIQNNSCPVFDNEKDLLYQGYHLTMTTKGGITLSQEKFPAGFYIVFVVKRRDEECSDVRGASAAGWMGGMGREPRVKGFRFRIVATVSYKEYLVAAAVTLAFLVLVVLLVLAALLPCSWRCYEEITIQEELITPSTSGTSQSLAGEGEELLSGGQAPVSTPEAGRPRVHARTVDQHCKASPEQLARRADRYFWGALTLAVVYSLPVVQLLYTYQRMVFQTGNQDLCYYNFLCAHPLGSLSDANHVFSNVGYGILGLAFLAHVRLRQRARPRDQGLGIPQHYGLLYSMGLALIMEGALSACYHLCPNKMNFQFDSSFMYVIAVLCMLKLYQNRHSDLIPSAHSTFMVLATIMALGLCGMLWSSAWFSALFAALHMSCCLVLTLYIYYAGSFRLEAACVSRVWVAWREQGRAALVPARPTRALLLALAVAANGAVAAYSLVKHNEDFARQMLAILLGNAILYTLFYLTMKLVHGEPVGGRTWLWAALAALAWGGAASLFLHSTTKWGETPAQSRRHNEQCSALHFYDQHDLWHLTSACAMFFSLHMLLTIDDAVRDTPRDQLPTF